MAKKKHISILIRILLWITVAITAIYLVSAFIGYADPRKCGFLSIAGLAYPITLLITLALTVALLIIHKKYALIPAAALITTIPQILAFSPIHYNRFWSDRQEGDFTIMTYNSFGLPGADNKANRTITEILKYDADFVCMQEAPKIDQFKHRIGEEQLNLLEKRYPYMGDSNAAMCFLSKHPVNTIRTHKDKKYFAFCVYETQVFGQQAYIFNIHLESIGLTASDKELYMDLTSVNKEKTLRGVRSRLMTKLSNAFKNRAGQAEMIRGIIDSLQTVNKEARIFVCGDFNDTPYSYSYLTIKKGFNDAYADAGIGPTFTYNANRLYFHIDHILYEDDNIEAVSTRRGNSRSSDHYPLVSTFRKKENLSNN